MKAPVSFRGWLALLLLATLALPLRAQTTTPLAKTLKPRYKTMTLSQVQQATLGQWVSIAPELRPSAAKNPDGSAKPFYLTRTFTSLPGDKFELVIVNSADPYGKVPLARIALKGRLEWQGGHPIAPGAQKVKFTADEGYEVTPLLPAFADVLNHAAGTAAGYQPWQVGQAQSVLNKAFAPFGLVAGQPFAEYDLIYPYDNLLFWGARHVDGRGFDTEANRPTNLQIPLTRVK